MVFPVVIYVCESWIIKKDEHRRIDAFELWCWRWLLRVPGTPRRSVLNIHWKDWCWSWNYNTLSTWGEELTHLKWQIDAGKLWGQEEKGKREDKMVGWHHRLNGREFQQTPGGKWRTGKPGVLQSMGLQRVAWLRVTWLSDWSTTSTTIFNEAKSLASDGGKLFNWLWGND